MILAGKEYGSGSSRDWAAKGPNLLGIRAAVGLLLVIGLAASWGETGDRMARALAFRVGFSILLFLCILMAWRLGWIQPTGIPAGA